VEAHRAANWIYIYTHTWVPEAFDALGCHRLPCSVFALSRSSLFRRSAHGDLRIFSKTLTTNDRMFCKHTGTSPSPQTFCFMSKCLWTHYNRKLVFQFAFHQFSTIAVNTNEIRPTVDESGPQAWKYLENPWWPYSSDLGWKTLLSAFTQAHQPTIPLEASLFASLGEGPRHQPMSPPSMKTKHSGHLLGAQSNY
jgi:hypothetical protein